MNSQKKKPSSRGGSGKKQFTSSPGSRGRGKGSPGSRGRGKGSPGSRGRGDNIEIPEHWGGVARKSAVRFTREDREDREDRARRTAEFTRKSYSSTQSSQTLQNEDSEQLYTEAAQAVARARKKGNLPSPKAHRRSPLPKTAFRLPDAETMLRRTLGEKRGKEAVSQLKKASWAFEEERFEEARRLLNALGEKALLIAEVVELLGLTHYRLGHWKAAVEKLEDFRRITGSTEQHPVLADSYRAQGRWADVEELWDELKASSPGAALVTEGRLVASGALADQDRFTEAILLLERGWNLPRRPQDHHLRRVYALADLYERSGSTPRARELFAWIQKNSKGFADTAERLRILS